MIAKRVLGDDDQDNPPAALQFVGGLSHEGASGNISGIRRHPLCLAHYCFATSRCERLCVAESDRSSDPRV